MYARELKYALSESCYLFSSYRNPKCPTTERRCAGSHLLKRGNAHRQWEPVIDDKFSARGERGLAAGDLPELPEPTKKQGFAAG
jgi:hypothetical protein